MLDFSWMLWINVPVADKIHQQSNKIATCLGNRATGESKRNDIHAEVSKFIQQPNKTISEKSTYNLW